MRDNENNEAYEIYITLIYKYFLYMMLYLLVYE